ncbi:MAG TPA: hypothetical protein DER09_05135 [Prolixibacteraceae bacterium]|nr:hypothetical protein [Prolixibacteraceae bacterium]
MKRFMPIFTKTLPNLFLTGFDFNFYSTSTIFFVFRNWIDDFLSKLLIDKTPEKKTPDPFPDQERKNIFSNHLL